VARSLTKMGQYYIPVFLNKKGEIIGWMSPHAYSNGSKLTEHSYISNNFVTAVELLLTSPRYAESSVVWAGDYADPEVGGEKNLYHICQEEKEDLLVTPEESTMSLYDYIVNHTKKQFVSKERSEKYTTLHPLPLLTCDGNGRGGGDYYDGRNHTIIGYWARDSISVEKKRPDEYVEIIFDLGKVLQSTS
jgi:hypothetical protein